MSKMIGAAPRRAEKKGISPPFLRTIRGAETRTFELRGCYDTTDVDTIVNGIDLELSELSGLECVVFDLVNVSPSYNNNGRLYDFARHVAQDWKFSQTNVEMLLTKELYEDLRQSDDLPDAEVGQSPKEGRVTFRLQVAPHEITQPVSRLKEPERNQLFRTYVAKVRKVRNETVTVSLFPDGNVDEEVLGELSIRQFPEKEVSVGQIFNYNVMIRGPGVTEVVIVPVPVVEIHPDDFKAMYEEALKKIPDNI